MKRIALKPTALLCLILFKSTLLSAAETVENIYEAIVPLADSSIESRNAAISRGLEQVLVRFSGYSGIANLSGVSAALSGANSYAVEFSVETEWVPADDGLTTKKAKSLWVRYNASRVDALFERHQLPIWPTLRSSVRYILLNELWGEVVQMDSQSYPAMSVAVDSTLKQRGLQHTSYTTDLFSASEMWRLNDIDAYKLRNESGADLLMIIKAVPDPVLGTQAEVMVVEKSNISVFRERNMDAIRGAQHILNNFVDQYSTKFAFIGGSGQNLNLFVSITGLGEFAAYKDMLNLIGGIDQVSSVRLDSLRGDEMMFRVSYGSDSKRLLNAILTRADLKPVSDIGQPLGTRQNPLKLYAKRPPALTNSASGFTTGGAVSDSATTSERSSYQNRYAPIDASDTPEATSASSSSLGQTSSD